MTNLMKVLLSSSPSSFLSFTDASQAGWRVHLQDLIAVDEWTEGKSQPFSPGILDGGLGSDDVQPDTGDFPQQTGKYHITGTLSDTADLCLGRSPCHGYSSKVHPK